MSRKRILAALCFAAFASPSSFGAHTLVYSNDFDGSVFLAPGVSGGLSGYTHTEPGQGFVGLGFGTNKVQGSVLYNDTGDNFTNQPSQKSVLELSDLPTHSAVDLNFLLLIIDTWDGASADYLNVSVDGTLVFQESFKNSSHDPSYPPVSQTYTNPATVVHIGGDLGFDGSWDTLYDMQQEDGIFGAIPHTASTIKIEWWADGQNWNRPANEAWGMDNLNLLILNVPEPGTYAMGAVGVAFTLLLIARQRRKMRSQA